MDERYLTASDKQIVIMAVMELQERGYQYIKYGQHRATPEMKQFLRRVGQLVLILQGRENEVAQEAPAGSVDEWDEGA